MRYTDGISALRGTKIIVWGHMAHAPFGGMTWQVINYLVGLRQLGCDVWYVEDSDANMFDIAVSGWAPRPAQNAGFVARHLRGLGLSDRWVIRVPRSRECFGALDWDGMLALYRDADVVLNLCGSHELRAHHDGIRTLVYVETDPAANQVALSRGVEWKRQELSRYTARVTYASNLGGEGCLIPETDLTWTPTVPPVAVDLWQTAGGPPREQFTTVMNWSSPEGAVEWQGMRWQWSKREAFQRIIPLPGLCNGSLEVAARQLGAPMLQELESHGWHVVDAKTLDRPERYRRYIRASMGEVSVAKQQYVAPRSGWISDRTVCYLAAGRPSVVERTHIRGIPLGVGLVDFEGVDEAASAINDVVDNLAAHERAARELAAEYFAAAKVLARMFRDIQLC